MRSASAVAGHSAGDTSHWKLGDARQTEVNVEGTRNVVAAALRGGLAAAPARVGVILTGGNVDPALVAELIGRHT